MKRQHVRGIIRESEADQTPWRQEPRVVATLHGWAKKPRIDDAMDLPQRHAGDRGRLICSHERRWSGGHTEILPHLWKDILLSQPIRQCAGLLGRRPKFGSPAPRSRPIRDGAMLLVPRRCFLRHLRPGIAEVSLRHLFGWVVGGCGSSNLT